MLKGYKEESYYLMMCYHGVWFIPQFVLNFLYSQFKKNRKGPLYVFSYLLEGILIIRNLKLVIYPYRIILKWKQKGFVYVMNFIIKKLIRIASQKSYLSTEGDNLRYESKL